MKQSLTFGHSGARLSFHDRHVRKACGEKQAKSLRASAFKQAVFQGYGELRAPAVMHAGRVLDGSEFGFRFSMDRIDGTHPMMSVDGFFSLNRAIAWVVKNIRHSLARDVPGWVVQEKVRQVRDALQGKLMAGRREVEEAADCLMQRYEADALTDVPMGVCHGDLTFANMLQTTNYTYVIDFAEQLFESPLFDVVKLRQDTAHKWSWMLAGGDGGEIDWAACADWDDVVWAAFPRMCDSAAYRSLQTLNLLRICPYVTSERVAEHLQEELIACRRWF